MFRGLRIEVLIILCAERSVNKFMGKIFYVMGKSASGKDTVYKMIQERFKEIKTVVLYTTRPKRDGERDGVEYYFTSIENMESLKESGKIIEARTYDTIYGPWIYFTVDDGQFDLDNNNYIMIGTLESYTGMMEYFGKDKIIPIYIYVDDSIRLQRALDREKSQKHPKYKELCRRYLADEEDFKEENMERCNILRRYENENLEKCMEEIFSDIKHIISCDKNGSMIY